MAEKICYYCKIDDPKISYQKDHIHGKSFDETIWTCLNCHAIKTHYQNRFSPKIRNKNAKQLAKLLYALDSSDATIITIIEQRMKIRFMLVKELEKCGLL